MPENTDTNHRINPQSPNPQVPQTPQEPALGAAVNPEIASVQVNRPETSKIPPTMGAKPVQSPAAPKKIGKEKLEASKRRFILGCMGGFISLFVIFMVLMVLMISRSGASNPVMRAFGLDPGGVRVFLQGVVGFAFGILSLLFLLLLIVGLFKYLGAQKGDKEKRGRNLRMTIINTFALIFMVTIWAVLANYIGKIEIAAERVIAQIVVLKPDNLNDLTAPVEITFSALDVAKALEMSGIKLERMNWDLDGDGNFETPVVTPEVTRLYDKKGTYNVALQVKVIGEENYRTPFTKLISIPNAAFAAQPSVGTAPLVVEFDASSILDRSNMASIDWDFDNDGIYERTGVDNLRVRYTFEQIGVYRVHLRAIDKNNNVENYYRNIEVVPADQPIVSAIIDATPGLKGPIPFQIRFDAGRSTGLKGNLIKYQWDFGDGTDLQSGKSTSHVFNRPGFYLVSLTIEDELGNKATNTVEVEAQSVSSAPEAIISTSPSAEAGLPLTGKLPFKIEFDASGSLDADNDIVQYEWDFNNDGAVDQEGRTATYTFEKAGTYTVKLTVGDSEGQKGSALLNVVVEEPGIIAVITAVPEDGTAPLTVQFDGSSSSAYQSNIVSYEWDFGDGSPKTVTGAIVSHKYNTVGSYEAKLKVIAANNESASASKLIYVREVPLRACFVPSRTQGLAPLTVTFDSKCSTGAVTGYHWQYGDGDESNAKNPTHTFDFPGTYTVILEVTDSKNNVSTYQELIVAEGDVE